MTHGADPLHGEQDRGEEQRHVTDGRDPRTGPDVGQRLGRSPGTLAGEQADAGHHPGHGAAQPDQYERRGYGRERYEQPERADDAERHQWHGQAEDPGADRIVPFRGRVRVGNLLGAFQFALKMLRAQPCKSVSVVKPCTRAHG